jgi:DNA-binding IclR family transcriptional regulator
MVAIPLVPSFHEGTHGTIVGYSERTSEPGRSVSSRLLEVLFAFGPGHSRLTLAGLARRTGMPKATVRRLALELVRAGALEMASDGVLTVGTRLWQLGTLAPLTEPLRTVAQPFMEDLYTALRQHVQLAVLASQRADSVATRIMNADGQVVAALSVVVRSGSVAPRTVMPSVVASGLGISRRLGWAPDIGARPARRP